MLLERGIGFALVERHIERLKTSARYFGFACDEAAVRAALADAVGGKSERLRVRLLLSEAGAVTVTSTPLPAADPGAVMRFVISETRLDSADIFLFHKTTRRELYDREWQQYHDALGAGEVVYLNERGELCEGSRTTIFLEREGRLLTPALASGLLPGTLRAELIAEGRAVESVLNLQDLESADAIYLGNSVRGLVRAEPLR
jgi:para-aminobenzoate synthetase / 4-amino-4-deoxychorismate lyase